MHYEMTVETLSGSVYFFAKVVARERKLAVTSSF